MMYETLKDFLHQLKQDHLLEGADTLSEEQMLLFMQQLLLYDASLLQKQRAALSRPRQACVCKELISPTAINEDEDLVSFACQGKIASVILAGGMGSRLGVVGSKALFPIAPLTGKTLLQLLMEKAGALCRFAGRALAVAVVVNKQSKEEIESFIQKHDYFGLVKESVTIVCQAELPFLTESGDWALQGPGKLLLGPDGNGMALSILAQSGVLSAWQGKGVEYVNVVQIDNPLADPFDVKMVHAMQKAGADIAVRAVGLEHANEPLGLVVRDGDRVKIIEYSEVPVEKRNDLLQTGAWQQLLASTGIMAFSLSFLSNLPHQPIPWHLAHKKVRLWQKDRGEIEKFLWKFEYFLFDLFDYTKKVVVISSRRESCYAPLKTLEGPMGVGAVAAALLSTYRSLYEKISGCKAPERPFELGPAFFYPDNNLYQRWKGRPLPEQDYIDM